MDYINKIMLISEEKYKIVLLIVYHKNKLYKKVYKNILCQKESICDTIINQFYIQKYYS